MGKLFVLHVWSLLRLRLKVADELKEEYSQF